MFIGQSFGGVGVISLSKYLRVELPDIQLLDATLDPKPNTRREKSTMAKSLGGVRF